MKACPLKYLIYGQAGKYLACSINDISDSVHTNNAPSHIKHKQPSAHPGMRDKIIVNKCGKFEV
jgi:uncharacterized protein YaiI (UPF0178 family)